MNDPQVEAIEYRLVPDHGLTFDSPPDQAVETARFQGLLSGGVLRLQLKVEVDSIEAARALVEPYLRAWELQAALHYIGGMRFEFAKADLVDRSPSPLGNATVHALGVSTIAILGHATATVKTKAYPAPPSNFASSPLVETLWHRLERHGEGKEPLPGMAYFVFTELTADAGGVEAAAQKFNIDPKVLRKISELSSIKGDKSSARKAFGAHPKQPLTSAETDWLIATIRAVILQVGAVAATGAAPRLHLAALPPL